MELMELVVSRRIAARAEDVFDVWMDAKSPGGPWFMNSGDAIIDTVVNGLFYFSVSHEGRMWAHYGRFIAIERPAKAEYTWVSEATKGVETVVTVTFEPKGDETEVTLRHQKVPDDEMGHKHKGGWEWLLASLAERFEKKG
jgi:uncharacterized protein YndB with AHSA1/START domain